MRPSHLSRRYAHLRDAVFVYSRFGVMSLLVAARLGMKVVRGGPREPCVGPRWDVRGGNMTEERASGPLSALLAAC